MKTIELKDLSIDILKKQLADFSAFYLVNTGGDLFNAKNKSGNVVGCCFDTQSINIICKIYEALSPQNQEKFNTVVLRDEYKFANFLDKMWGWVKFTKE